MLSGRRYMLRVAQDAVGGHTLGSEVGEFASVAGVVSIDIDTVALKVTDIIIQGPSSPFGKPTIYQTFKDVRVTTP